MTHIKSVLALFFAIFTAVSPASAELASNMTAHIVTTGPDGKETRAPADRAEPGDIVEYRLTHTNTFETAISGVAIMGPIPEGMTLVDAFGGQGAPAVFEVRGPFDPDRPGEEWSTLPAVKITIAEDGARVRSPATPDDYTAIRWRLTAPLARDVTVLHSYRTRVQ